MAQYSAGEGQRLPSRFRSQVESVFETQIARYPFLVQMRAVLRQLEHERENWPILIPFLLVVFLFTYRRARKRVLEIERELRK